MHSCTHIHGILHYLFVSLAQAARCDNLCLGGVENHDTSYKYKENLYITVKCTPPVMANIKY